MKQDLTLTVTSLLSIVLATVHLADDIARGLEQGGPSVLIAVPVLVAWAYGAIVFAGRRSGYIIMILGSLLGMVIPWVHFRGTGGVLGSGITSANGALFFVGILLVLAVTAGFSFVLAVHRWWSFERQRSK